MRDPGTILRHRFQLLWKVRFASSGSSKILQHGGILIGILGFKDADRVNQRAGLLGGGQDFVELVAAPVVSAVADDDEHSLVEAGGAQMIQGDKYGVVERGLASRGGMRNGQRKLVHAIRETGRRRQAKSHLFVEIDDEHLIVGPTGLDEQARGFHHFRQLVAHAAAVVDDQSNGDRHVLMLKKADGLLYAVLEYLKVRLGEIGDKPSLAIAHGRVHDHKIDINRDLV